jgi:protein-L-isoaspartate(D-aspartate) O-methyltransferase
MELRHRRELVARLEAARAIETPRVRDAFLAVPRELFVPEFAERAGLEAVYRDEVILTKRSRDGTPLSSSSQPAIMALMLERLRVEPGMSVLEIGAGTGYNAALLAELVGPGGRVVSVDVDPEVAAGARRALRAGGYGARVVTADGRDGRFDGAPFHRIVVTASADAVPVAWFEELYPDGLLEVPVRLSAGGAQAIPLLRRTARGFRSERVLGGVFMPLRGASDEGSRAAVPTLAATAAGERSALLRQISGEALRTLGDRARVRLLSIALGEGRTSALPARAPANALTLFLSLRLPADRLVTTGPRFGIGAIARDGGSLGVIEPAFAPPEREVRSLRAFGDERAARVLGAHVKDWQRRGRPRPDDLAVTVTFDADGRSRIAARWPRGR